MGLNAWRSVGWLVSRDGKHYAHCETCKKTVQVRVMQCSEDGEEAVCTQCNEQVLGD